MLVAAGLLAAVGYALEPIAPQDESAVGNLATNALGNADSNNRMIAVTGVDITGSTILYLIDTVNPHIAVYQANGGSSGTQSIKLVAARRIDLDLQLDGLNDKSEHTYKELHAQFVDQGLIPPP